MNFDTRIMLLNCVWLLLFVFSLMLFLSFALDKTSILTFVTACGCFAGFIVFANESGKLEEVERVEIIVSDLWNQKARGNKK